MLLFLIVNSTLYLKLPPLAIRVSGDLQMVGFKKSDVITSSIPTTPPWLLTRPVVNFPLHCSDKTTLLRKCSNIVFVNFVMSSRTTIAYSLMALKKVTELLLLRSIETILSVSITWYSKHLQSWIICPFACDRCGPAAAVAAAEQTMMTAASPSRDPGSGIVCLRNCEFSTRHHYGHVEKHTRDISVP